MNKLYTAQEVADRLKIKKTTVYELIKRGELSSSKIGKQLRISEEQLAEYVTKFEQAMEDDLNTADAISTIFELVKFTNSNITAESAKSLVEKALDTIRQLCDVLGIITKVEKEILDSDIEALIEERQAARKAKNFARADEIRDTLAAQGIILEDTREGVKWKRA